MLKQYFEFFGYVKCIKTNFTCYFLFFVMCLLKIKIAYLAHMTFLLDRAVLDSL